MMVETHWEKEGYGDITAVESSFGALTVTFANGDVVELQIADLGLPNDSGFRLEKESHSLIALPPSGEEREIDWMLIRRLDDPGFAEALRERDAEESRRIGRRLRALRENKGISQKDAARWAGMAASQLAKIESGKSDLRISTVQGVLRAIGGSLGDIARPDAPEVSVQRLELNAAAAGAPRPLVGRIAARVDPGQAAKLIAHGFGWKSSALVEGAPATEPLSFAVSFKNGPRGEAEDSPLLRLARTVSELTASGYQKPLSELPKSAKEVRQQVLAESKTMSLVALTRWAWRRGIVVMPMSGPDFSAAAWYVEQRPVVVLKVAHDYLSYWLFTLAHEIGHLVLGHIGEEGVVEVKAPGARSEDKEENDANRFALELLVPDSERLFEEIRKRSGETLKEQKETFKWRAKDVAKEAGVDHALLALVAAYALEDVAEGTDRWGSAINFAKEQGPARPFVQEIFAEQVDLEPLPELDRALVEAVVLE